MQKINFFYVIAVINISIAVLYFLGIMPVEAEPERVQGLRNMMAFMFLSGAVVLFVLGRLIDKHKE